MAHGAIVGRPDRTYLVACRRTPVDRLSLGTSMPETVSAAASLLSSRPLLLVAAAVGIVLAATVALWAHYGTAVFYEMIVAGIAACL
jgi:Ca2+/Na+ antiporter